MSKPWQPYAQHILDAIAKIHRIQARGDLTQDEVLYDAALRNLQTLSEAKQLLQHEHSNMSGELADFLGWAVTVNVSYGHKAVVTILDM
jgi:uncharacterized protein with HEPN domain